MAILKNDAIRKMNQKERDKKIKDLKFELVKAQANKQGSGTKIKEIKRTIARLLTITNLENKSKEIKN